MCLKAQMEAKIFNWLRKDRGFTILEMALIVGVAGFLIMPVYYLMFNIIKLGPTDQRFEAIRYGIGEYYRVWGRLPCPGSLDAAPGDADYDRGTRDGAANCTSGVAAGGTFIGSVPVQDLAAAMDCLPYPDYDPSVNYATNPPPAGSRAEYILNLPADARRTLQRDIYKVPDVVDANRENSTKSQGIQKQNCVTMDMLLDEHGSKIVYAVSANTTRLASFDPADPAAGVIRVVDQSGTNDLSENGQWFVLASMGEDKKGAYDKEGNMGVACTAFPGLDQENCDLSNAVFRDMPIATTQAANHFDDYIEYSLDNALSELDFWYWHADNDADDSRNLTFQPDTRMIIDIPAAGVVDTNDRVVVNNGNIMAKRDGTAGGNVMVGGTDRGVYSEKFCYDDPLETSCAP